MITHASRPMNLAFLYLMFGFVPALFSSGCAVIEDIRSDGSMRREIALGALVNVVPAPLGRSRLIRMSGLGVASSPDAVTLGYFNTLEIALDPACRIVLIGSTPEQLEYFASLVRNAQGICDDITAKGDEK